MSSNVSAQSSYFIPSWIRNVAGWWSQGQVSDDDFVNGLQYMIQNGIIKKPTAQGAGDGSQKIPSWIRNVAGWWAKMEVGDDEYVKALQWLIDTKILVVAQTQQSQNMTLTPQRLIATFAPHLNDALLSVLDKHKTDFGINFRIKNLQLYDSQQRILLGFSSDSVNNAIQQVSSSSLQIQYIGYDNEPNNALLSTPPDEVADPATFTNHLADAVHNAGFKYAITPSRDLLQAEYQKVDWTKVDLIVIQMQRISGNETKYHSYLDPIVSFIKTKNPNTLALAQVNPQFDSISHITSVIQGTSLIDGVSIVVTTTTPGEIDDLLTALRS
jgi:hypothetical protein